MLGVVRFPSPLALALLSCAARSPEAPQAPASLDVAMTVSPMPTADLSGTKVLVDSGATVHAVRRTGAPSRARVLDAHGAPMDAERLDVSPIAGVGGAWFGVAGLPVPAIVSPQAMLAPGQSAELAMRSGRFRVNDDPRTGATLVARSSVRAVKAACGNVFLVESLLGGHAVRLLIDTGSARTTLRLASPTTRAFRKWSNYPASIPDPTGNHAAWVVLAVPISVAGYESDLDLVVSDDPDEPCDVDGALGMDVLRHCDLVLMRGAAGLSCG